MSSPYSDGFERNRRIPARGNDGHGRPCIVDVYGTVLAHEDRTGEWHIGITGGEWSNLLDLAEAILAADKEDRP